MSSGGPSSGGVSGAVGTGDARNAGGAPDAGDALDASDYADTSVKGAKASLGITIPSAPNLRDLGGIPTASGPVRHGRLFRSATLSSLSDADVAAIARLGQSDSATRSGSAKHGADRSGHEEPGLRAVYDLRTSAEAAAAPDRLPAGIALVPLDVLADSSLSVAATLGDLHSDPQGFAKTLEGGKAERLFEDTYRDLIRLPSALGAYRAFVLGLIDGDRAGAALFHCTTGKDRTGWAAALVLGLLGASEEHIYADYLRTNTDLLPALEPVIAQLGEQGIDRELLLPVLGVQASYLDAAFAQVREQFGSLERYARDGLGLSPQQLDELRVRLT